MTTVFASHRECEQRVVHHLLVGSLEIINSQEESDPTRKLLAYDPRLMLTVRAREQKTGRTNARPNNNPALGATIVCQRRAVLDEFEAQGVHEKVDRRIVIANDQCHEFKV